MYAMQKKTTTGHIFMSACQIIALTCQDYVDMSDNHVRLSYIYVDVPDVDMSDSYINMSCHDYVDMLDNYVDMSFNCVVMKGNYVNSYDYVDISDNYIIISANCIDLSDNFVHISDN